MSFDDLVDAIRAADGDDPALAANTQLRVRRSLEGRARGRQQLVGVMTALAILMGGTVSWALATGELASLWAPVPRTPRVEVAVPPTAPHGVRAPRAPSPAPLPAPAIVAAPTERLRIKLAPYRRDRRSSSGEADRQRVEIDRFSPSELSPVAPPEPPSPAPPSPAPPSPAPPSPAPPVRAGSSLARAVAPPPVEALYRRAHDLHFHGGAPADALAAWDAYLAAEPGGTFSVEARYNRALVLARLGRYAEAHAALLPFARGEVEPAGYRQSEAQQLVARLADHAGKQ